MKTIDQLADRTLPLPLSDSQVVGYLIGDKGVTARELQRVSHCTCQFSSKSEDPSVKLTGSPEELEIAKHYIEAKLKQYERENRSMKLPELGLPLFRTPNHSNQLFFINRDASMSGLLNTL